MVESDKHEFLSLMTGVAQTYNKQVGDMAIVAFWNILKDYSLDEVRRGVTFHVKTSKWMPRPVELLECIKTAGAEMPVADRAALTWQYVSKACKSVGRYRSIDFDDIIVNAVIRNMGGWSELCGRQKDTFESFTRKEYEEQYERICRVGAQREEYAHLPGAGVEAERLLASPPVVIKTGLPPHERLTSRGAIQETAEAPDEARERLDNMVTALAGRM